MAILSPVPLYRPGVARRAFQAGRPVSSAAPEWSTLVELQNWVRSRGASYVPAFRPDHAPLPGGATYTYPTYFRVHEPAIRRVWAVTVAGPSNPYTLSDVQATSGTLGTAAGAPAQFLSPMPARRATDEEVALTLDLTSATVTGDAGVTNEYVVEQIGCVAEPRAAIEDDAIDLAINPARIRTGSVLTSGALANMRTLASGDDMTPRTLACWAVPALVDGSLATTYARSATGGATFTVWPSFVPALARRGLRADTRRLVRARVFYWMVGGEDAGAFVESVTGGPGNSVALTNDTSGRWSDELTVDLDVEDLAAASGLVGGDFDGVNITIQSLGFTTVYVAGAVVYESDATSAGAASDNPEDGLTATHTDATSPYTPVDRTNDMMVAIDLTIPASPASSPGLLFEVGSSTRGFVVSVGDGSTGIISHSAGDLVVAQTLNTTVGMSVVASLAGVAGQTGTLLVHLDPSNIAYVAWRTPSSLILLGSSASTLGVITDFGQGDWGAVAGTAAQGAASLAAATYVTGGRAYENTPLPPTFPTV